MQIKVQDKVAGDNIGYKFGGRVSCIRGDEIYISNDPRSHGAKTGRFPGDWWKMSEVTAINEAPVRSLGGGKFEKIDG